MPAYPVRAAFAGILLFIIGLAIAAGAWEADLRGQERLRGWRRADGSVVELLKRRSPDGDVSVPLIAFTTAAGERISFTASDARKDSPYYIADAVKVLYHPDHPQDALIDTSARWTRNALAGAAALVLMGMGGYVAWYASTQSLKPEA
jgi:hypothetical protein